MQHHDMVVPIISIDIHCDGERVAEILEEVTQKMGCPAQIVTDGGSNLKKGIRIFKDSHPQVVGTSDITHRVALSIKAILKDDPRWKEFEKKIGEAKNKAAQTAFAFAVPPKSREKSRWQNLDVVLKWADDLQNKRDKANHSGKLTKTMAENKAKFEELFGWVDGFHEDLAKWKDCLAIANTAKFMVKENGLCRSSADDFQQILAHMHICSAAALMAEDLTAFLRAEGAMIPDAESWLGCSDIIESILGKYKLFTSRTPMIEMGKAALMIPSMISKVSPQEVEDALASVSVKDVDEWLKKHIGDSILAKRKMMFGSSRGKNKMKKFDDLPLKTA